MSTTADLLGIPLEFVFEGKTFKVARKITVEMEAALADWVLNSAMDRIERQRQLGRARKGSGMSEEQYQRALDRHSDNIAAGRFEWEGDLVIQAMNQLPGNKQMTLLRFKKYQPDVTLDLIEKIFNSEDDLRRLGLLINPPTEASEENAANNQAAPQEAQGNH